MSRAGPGADQSHSHALEIERKYLLGTKPAIPQSAEIWKIRQGYLNPSASGSSAASSPFAYGRIRCVELPDGSKVFTHTMKDGAGLVRSEIEQEITPREFERLWPRTRDRRLSKTRYRVREGDLIWEIDVFDGIDLVLAEVELPSPTTSAAIPPWLKPHILREVTDDPLFTNANIALRIMQRR
ncbi:MAG: hypothetical protein L0Y44_00235 [Phycisphaerales bacterium]|nr:hypothetical protein [Phycisphaerales bacterium]MCI0629064.1 hypothetical protein [Phycisphaerales bacterium]MCI0675638.1 hypothetical protein [Phycisphaerales bacterium]